MWSSPRVVEVRRRVSGADGVDHQQEGEEAADDGPLPLPIVLPDGGVHTGPARVEISVPPPLMLTLTVEDDDTGATVLAPSETGTTSPCHLTLHPAKTAVSGASSSPQERVEGAGAFTYQDRSSSRQRHMPLRRLTLRVQTLSPDKSRVSPVSVYKFTILPSTNSGSPSKHVRDASLTPPGVEKMTGDTRTQEHGPRLAAPSPALARPAAAADTAVGFDRRPAPTVAASVRGAAPSPPARRYPVNVNITSPHHGDDMITGYPIVWEEVRFACLALDDGSPSSSSTAASFGHAGQAAGDRLGYAVTAPLSFMPPEPDAVVTDRAPASFQFTLGGAFLSPSSSGGDADSQQGVRGLVGDPDENVSVASVQLLLLDPGDGSEDGDDHQLSLEFNRYGGCYVDGAMPLPTSAGHEVIVSLVSRPRSDELRDVLVAISLRSDRTPHVLQPIISGVPRDRPVPARLVLRAARFGPPAAAFVEVFRGICLS